MKNILVTAIIWFALNSAQSQNVTTFAGSTQGPADGTGTAAQFGMLQCIAADALGNLYVADVDTHKIRKISALGVVTTVAGSISGFADGTGSAAQFNSPYGIATDAAGNLYVGDRINHKIRKVSPTLAVTTLAGSTLGAADGTGSAAQFYFPRGVATDAIGNVYVADRTNHRIRKVTASGVVTTLAGSTTGFADGTGNAAQFGGPRAVATDASGNVYVADTDNHRIRKITSAGVVTTLAGSTQGFADGTGTAALFDGPNGLTVDTDGNVYVTDRTNHKIRKITAAGVVTTIAGSTDGYVDGFGSAAKFSNPSAITIDPSGNLYVADTANYKIRKITIALDTKQNTAIGFNVSVFPNPASAILQVQIENFESNVQLSITNILGKQIYSQTIDLALSTINTSSFAKGVYMLTLQNGDKKTTKKVIIE